uniref:Phosphoglucomutase-2 n=1 Tax=Coccidioides posadasii RMSCC 3488 TaxID=454284 RepID=A0A0J6FPN9_COCPO|nr:phosphoglucomutase-2 [Coccidioides posadasii RMSCC 3488]
MDNTMEPLETLVQRWLDWDQDPQTREEIKNLHDSHNLPELEKRLRKRIQFGTAGLRGRMQAGFSYMNCLTVIQASQGLGKYLKALPQTLGPLSVVIGRDGRHNSGKFAILAANAFRAEGIHVWCFNNPVPTPLVAYAVPFKKAIAGIVITASHNPAQDNGYKIYSANGAQINSPIDAHIRDFISHNLEPWTGAWDSSDSHYSCTDAFKELQKAYCDDVCAFVASTADLSASPGRFVYTPLHGVGYSMMSELCEVLSIQGMTVVSEQRDPDPGFPTVRFPNPEEAGALDLAMKTADDLKIDIVIANDPDADRFAVAEKVGETWFKFTGDQVGVLLASHLLDQWKHQEQEKPIAMLCTAVSSNMLAKMAKIEGFHFQETLTGFKWLGNVAKDLESEGYNVPFAFEEALGYMFCNVSYDKDGLTAAMVFLTAQARWRKQGFTPFSRLQHLYQTYGYHETLNTYFVSPDPSISATLFDSIRNLPEDKRSCIGGFPVLRWRDATKGFDTGTPNNVSNLPVDSASQMITIWSDKGLRFTLRGSGTEPKVKIYIESCCPTREDAVNAVCQVFLAVLVNWIQPFASIMTYAPAVTTSSGYIFNIP